MLDLLVSAANSRCGGFTTPCPQGRLGGRCSPLVTFGGKEAIYQRCPVAKRQDRTLPEPPSVPGARWIPLTRGKFALVDEADFEALAGRAWHAVPAVRGQKWYARSGQWNPETRLVDMLYMHRLLLPNVEEIDHWDGDGLNNRRENLRPATRSQNKANGSRYRNNASGFTGVVRRGEVWRAYLSHDGERIWVGNTFESAESAARARDAVAKEKFGEFARLNFPEGPPPPKLDITPAVSMAAAKPPAEKRVKKSVWFLPSIYKSIQHEAIDREMSVGEVLEEAMHARVMLIKK